MNTAPALIIISTTASSVEETRAPAPRKKKKTHTIGTPRGVGPSGPRSGIRILTRRRGSATRPGGHQPAPTPVSAFRKSSKRRRTATKDHDRRKQQQRQQQRRRHRGNSSPGANDPEIRPFPNQRRSRSIRSVDDPEEKKSDFPNRGHPTDKKAPVYPERHTVTAPLQPRSLMVCTQPTKAAETTDRWTV